MDPRIKRHEDSIDATFTLLREAIDAVGEKINYIVVGGWSPYLLCDHSGRHPGTRDVDLLFDIKTTSPALRELVIAFQDRGFIRSAKHDFQLLRPLQIGDSKFMFNVDFLHPMETDSSGSLFLDHIEWPEYSDKARNKHFRTKSIALPSAQLVFDHSLFVEHTIDRRGNSFKFPLVDELGLIITKLESFNKAKRDRDAYDIYLAVAKCRDSDALVSKTRTLRSTNDVLDALLMTFDEEISKAKTASTFKNRVKTYDDSTSEPVAEIKGFLEETAPS